MSTQSAYRSLTNMGQLLSVPGGAELRISKHDSERVSRSNINARCNALEELMELHGVSVRATGG